MVFVIVVGKKYFFENYFFLWFLLLNMYLVKTVVKIKIV